MATVTYTKDPNAKLDYPFNWAAWLPYGDTIASVAYVVASGLTLSADPPPSFSNTVATPFLQGGTLGETYSVVCRITTAAGRIQDQTIYIYIADQ